MLLGLVALFAGPPLFFPVEIGLWLQRKNFESKGLTKMKLNYDGNRLVYYAGGEGPKLVLLHGFLTDASNWIEAVPYLIERNRLYIPDMPGHGESDPQGDQLNMNDMLRGLDAFVDEISNDEPVVIAGNSMGGWVASLYALEHPEKVKKLILINSAGWIHFLQRDIVMPKTASSYRDKLNLMMGDKAPNLPEWILKKMAEKSLPRHEALFNDITSGDYLLNNRAALFDRPVYLIWGVPDGLFPLDYAREVEASLPESYFYTIEGGGHLPHYTEPEKFAWVMKNILARP